MTEYSELRVRFERKEGSSAYAVHASSAVGEVGGLFTVPVSKLEIENLVLRMSRTRTSVRRMDSPELELGRRFGADLFNALFCDRVRDLYRNSFTSAQADGKGLRITLALSDTPELMHLPWEYLYDEPSFLSISTWTPVVRYLDLPRGRRPLTVVPPLRILGMVSSPSDVVALDIEAEQRRLEESLSEVVDRGAVSINWLEKATLQALQRELRRGDYHIFHYIGHGGYDTNLDDGVLLLEDESGGSRRVTGMQLGTMLADEATLRLAVLNACEGARTSLEDPFAGVAASLVQREIAAVVAMQFEITDRAAIVFAGEFYSALADGYPVDAALAEARKAIFADHNDVEWGTPVLFMRVPDGRIFDIAPQPPSPVVREPPRSRPGREAPPDRDVPPPVRDVPPPERGDDVRQPRQDRDFSVAAMVGAVLLGVGVFYPWDRTGRSWIDLKFGELAHADHAGVFTALSPLALVVGTVLALARLRAGRLRSLMLGLLVGFGVTGAAKYFAVFGRAVSGHDTHGVSIAVLGAFVVGALLIAWSGARFTRSTPDGDESSGTPALLKALIVAGAILIVIGILIPFNGGGPANPSQTIAKRDVWEAIDPVVAALLALVATFGLAARRPQLAAGILLAAGIESVTVWLRYLGVPLIEDSSVASLGVGAVSGLAGAAAVFAAGWIASRPARVRATSAPDGAGAT